MNQQKPLVSVIVVNYNGERFVERCIEALTKSSYKNVEVLVVDNGSCDGSPWLLRKLLQVYENKSMRLICLARNYGPNIARNLGIRSTRGELCLFVDHDALVGQDAIELMVSFMMHNRDVGAVQSKLILMQEPDTVDTCGSYLTPFGFVCEPDNGKEASICNECKPVLGGRGWFMIRRSVLKEVGLFDDSLFLGWDETELFWRVWLRGYKVYSLPAATALHARSSARKVNIEGLLNGYRVFIGCLEFKNMIRISLLYSVAMVYLFVSRIAFNRRDLIELYKKTKQFLSDFSALIAKRKLIQSSVRKVRDANYMDYIRVRLSLSEMAHRFKRAF